MADNRQTPATTRPYRNARPMGRSTAEAWASLVLCILLVVLPMTWWLKIVCFLVVGALVVDLIWRSTYTFKLHFVLRSTISALAVLILLDMGATAVSQQY